VDATLTDTPCCPKGKAEYELAEDRKEADCSTENIEKEEATKKLIKKQRHSVNAEARYLKKG